MSDFLRYLYQRCASAANWLRQKAIPWLEGLTKEVFDMVIRLLRQAKEVVLALIEIREALRT